MNTTAVLPQPLVDATWIAEHLHDDTVRIVEIDVAPAAYRDGHIPGAVLWNIYADLRRPDYAPVEQAGLERLLSRCGLTPETTVVCYGYGAHLGYWLLRSHGHDDVRLMDGPRSQWLEAGYQWSLDEPGPGATAYPLEAGDPSVRASREDVLAMLARPGHLILDVRSRAEYEGERFWPSGAPEDTGRAGRIPGSIHVPVESLRDENGRFAEPGEMRRLLLELGVTPGDRVVTYCTIGNRASQAWYALTHLLEYPDAGVYYGSWAEWGMLPAMPVER